MKGQLWETRPLEFWAKAKELRAGWQKSIESKENIVGQGNMAMVDWAPAFTGLTLIEDNPVGAMMQNKNSPFARKCRLASEIRGWGREICGYQGNCWGAQFLGYQEDGSEFPWRKLVIPCMPCVCDQHAKRGQQVRDFAPVPQWMADQTIYFGPFDPERNHPMTEHNAYSCLKIINDLERVFGLKFDDEKFVQNMNTIEQSRDYAREVSLLMVQTIPAPISVKDLYSLYTLGTLTKIDPVETLNFWKMCRDEIKWRAENHIAAVGNERFRWIEAHPPSWHFMKYYRYMEKYGAVCLGSQYTHIMAGSMETREDGSVGFREKPGYPKDTPLETREDAIRYALGTEARPLHSFKVDEYLRRDSIVDFARICKADGALLPIWRHGLGCTLTRKEQAMYLRRAGLSVMHYEGSQPGDRTDLDEKRMLDQLDAWMQSLGMQMLDD